MQSDIQVYIRALSKALCARYPVDYPTILATAQDKLLDLQKRSDGIVFTHPSFRPLLRRAIINAVIDKARRVKRRNEVEIPYAAVYGAEDPEGIIANTCGTDTYSNNPVEQCDWEDFKRVQLTDTERILVDAVSELPKAMCFTGDGIKELRGSLRRYFKVLGMNEREYYRILESVRTKIATRTGMRRVYNGISPV